MAQLHVVTLKTASAIVRDLRGDHPSYNYDLEGCNGNAGLLNTLIAQRKRGQQNFSSALKSLLESIQETDQELYRTLTEEKRGPRGTLLSEVQPEEISWLWPGRLPRKKMVMADGEPGLGKSTIFYDLIARLSAGQPLPGETTYRPSCGAVVISLEDGLADTIQPRLARAGADLTRVSFLGYLKETTEEGREYERPFQLPGDIQYLEEEIKRVQAGLVLIDPIMGILGGKDTYKDNEVRAALAPLKTLAEEHDVTVVMIRHTTKARNDTLIYQGGGSVAFIGLARVGLLIAKNPDNSEQGILATAKNNLASAASTPKLLYRVTSEPGEDERAHIVWEGESNLTDQELMQPASQVPSATRQDILKVLKLNYPMTMTAQQVADAIEEDEIATVRTVLNRMVKSEQISKVARGEFKAHSGMSSSS